MTYRFSQILVVLVAISVSTALVTAPYDTVGGPILLGGIIVLLTIFLLPRLVPQDERPYLTSLLVLAVIAKMIATGFRLFMNNVVYGGGDLNIFDRVGSRLADLIRAGEFSAAFEEFSVGTSTMELITGMFYSITGTSFYGVFFVSGFIGFLGAVLFYRAFRIAFPNGNHRLFGLLIFFYPAVLYWPTGFGKDTFTFLALGLTVLGAAHFIVRLKVSGLVMAVAALTVMFLIRPETGLMATIAFITAFVLRRPSTNPRAFALQLVGVPIVMMAGFIFISQATSFLGIEELSLNSALNVVTEQSARVFDEGRSGSNFVPPQVGSPTWIPEAIMTVLFRPFLWEVHNLTSMIQSFDGVMLGLILFFSSGRLYRSMRTNGRNPIIVFSIVFVLMSVIALATLGNFGLLARQRVVVLPFIFIMITAATAVQSRVKAPEPAVAGDADSTSRARLAGANVS